MSHTSWTLLLGLLLWISNRPSSARSRWPIEWSMHFFVLVINHLDLDVDTPCRNLLIWGFVNMLDHLGRFLRILLLLRSWTSSSSREVQELIFSFYKVLLLLVISCWVLKPMWIHRPILGRILFNASLSGWDSTCALQIRINRAIVVIVIVSSAIVASCHYLLKLSSWSYSRLVWCRLSITLA